MGKQRDTELLRKLERNQQFAQSPQIIKGLLLYSKNKLQSVLRLGKSYKTSNTRFHFETWEETQ